VRDVVEGAGFALNCSPGRCESMMTSGSETCGATFSVRNTVSQSVIRLDKRWRGLNTEIEACV